MGTGIITALVGVICSALSGLITFLMTKKKYNSEVESQQIKNLNDAFSLYQKTMDSTMTSQKKNFEDKLEALQKENNDLRQQVSQLQMEMINILGTICLDTTCKMRKINFPPAPETAK